MSPTSVYPASDFLVLRSSNFFNRLDSSLSSLKYASSKPHCQHGDLFGMEMRLTCECDVLLRCVRMARNKSFYRVKEGFGLLCYSTLWAAGLRTRRVKHAPVVIDRSMRLNASAKAWYH